MMKLMVKSDEANAIKICLVGELKEEDIFENPTQTFDVPEESDEEMLLEERKEQVDKEREMFEEIPLPGAPLSEQERRKN
eukprot:7958986-Karenia_brevis.AAC.1